MPPIFRRTQPHTLYSIRDDHDCWYFASMNNGKAMVINKPILMWHGANDEVCEYQGTSGMLKIVPDEDKMGLVPYGKWKLSAYYNKNRKLVILQVRVRHVHDFEIDFAVQTRYAEPKLRPWVREINKRLENTLGKAIVDPRTGVRTPPPRKSRAPKLTHG
jgi:hypothetical protein